MNTPRVQWGNDGFASSSGWETAYTTHPITNEYLSTQEVWISVGTGLPASAFLDEPMQPESGKAIVRVGGSWELVDDYRGQTAYHKQTRQQILIDEIGPLHESLTITPPNSPFDVWNEQDQAWVKDIAQEELWLIQQAQAQRQSLMNEASQEIAVLVDALDPAIIGDPSDADQVKLIAWKAYRVELSKIDQQPTYPVSVAWPAKPV